MLLADCVPAQVTQPRVKCSKNAVLFGTLQGSFVSIFALRVPQYFGSDTQPFFLHCFGVAREVFQRRQRAKIPVRRRQKPRHNGCGRV